MAFNHENLKVYQRTLPFNSKVSTWTSQWDSKHAICDQLSRAAGSLLENLAMSSATYSLMKQRCLDYALGSCLECAACLDLASIKGLLDVNEFTSTKDELSQIFRMLVGLKRSWSNSAMILKEEQTEYTAQPRETSKLLGEKPIFNHETLDVYRVAIETAKIVCSSEAAARLSNPVFRRLDELLTSMILNIAEGNGRFSDADQARFLGTTHESAIKLAARLDLYVIQGLIPKENAEEWKYLLERVSLMTSSMIANIQER
jgi:four helix bundle protein